VVAFKRAVELDPSFKEAITNIGQAYKEQGVIGAWLGSPLLSLSCLILFLLVVVPLLLNVAKAIKYFSKTLKVDPGYLHAFHLRGLAHFSAGDHR